MRQRKVEENAESWLGKEPSFILTNHQGHPCFPLFPLHYLQSFKHLPRFVWFCVASFDLFFPQFYSRKQLK